MLDNLRKYYNTMKHHKIGLYWEFATPAVIVMDIELIKRVQVTDFDYFVDTGLFSEEYLATMGLQLGLSDLRGDMWKTLRRLLSPGFSAPRLKKTTHAQNRISRALVDHLRKQEEQGSIIEIEEDMKKFAMTCIADIAFGIDADCFNDPDNDFTSKGKALTEEWRFLMCFFFPKLMLTLRIPVFNPKSTKHFEKLCHQIVEQRRNSKEERKDILNSMIKAVDESPAITPEMIFKTMIQFFSDGFETFSGVGKIMIFLITAHPEVQQQLWEEVDSVVGDREDVNEEDLGNLTYLDQVMNEFLRMMPVPNTFRHCTKDYVVPGTDFTIPKGTKIIIPIGALHYDEEIWEEPEVFKPERWSPENKGNIPSVAFQPFGFGPRACIGYTLAKMELKIMACHLIKNFRFSPRGEMSMPMKMHPTKFFDVDGGVNVNISSREKSH